MAKGNNGLLGKKRPLEVCLKIAKSNTGKIFSEERRRNISESRKLKLTQQQLNEMFRLRQEGIVGDTEICRIFDISNTAYQRICKERGWCPRKNLFLPRDMSLEESRLIKKLGEQHVFYQSIAAITGRGKKQIYAILNKFGITPNTRNPDRKINYSKLENSVFEELKNRNILCDRQFNIDKFYFDLHVLGTNILVEIHGDYWHVNPQLYKNKVLTEAQRGNMRRDFLKRELARRNGFKRIVVWEKDLRENWESTISTLIERILRYESNNDE